MKILPLLLLALPALALDNSVRLYDASAATQTSQPRTIHRYFAQGEFPSGSYPKPRADGSVPASWQVDVENTWPDGSVMAAFVSLPVSIAANGSVVVDFVRDSNPCHLGNLATCQAAGLDQTGMTGFLSGAWDGIFEGTANAITYSASAKTMIGAGAWRYRLRGPVVTEVIAEDTSRPNPAYDFGWEFTGGNWAAPSLDKFKSVHPIFTVAFYAGWSGVEIEFFVQNPWTARKQRQVFDLAVKTGSGGGTTAYSKSGFDLAAMTAFNRLVWSGTAPASVQVDHNLKYMVSTKLMPPLDTNLLVPTTTANTLTTAYTNSLAGTDPQSCNQAGAMCAGVWWDLGDVGSRADIGLITQWVATYLYAMADTTNYNVAARLGIFDKLVLGNSDAAMTLPIHYRELDNSSVRDSTADGQRYYFNYQSDQTTPAWGRVVTIQARPNIEFGGNEAYVSANDAITPVCTASTCNGTAGPRANQKNWYRVETSHMPSAFFMTYWLTGRYSYQVSLIQQAGFAAGNNTANLTYGNRNQDKGILAAYSNNRGAYWSLREMFEAVVALPDGAPEKQYFKDILTNNDQFYEGVVGATGGNAQATEDCAPATMTGTKTSSYGNGNCYDGFSAACMFLPNGQVKRFVVAAEASGIVAVTGITVNGSAKTFGVYGVDTGRDFYYKPGGIWVEQDAAGTPLISTDTISVTYSYGPLKSNWCHGRQYYMKGLPDALGLRLYSSNGSKGVPTLGFSALGANGNSVFMLYYGSMVMRMIESSGAVLSVATGQPLFKYSNAAHAKYILGLALDPNFNMYFADQYVVPYLKMDGTLPQTFAELQSLYLTTETLGAALAAGGTSVVLAHHVTTEGETTLTLKTPAIIKVDNEWIQVCSYTNNSPTSGKSSLGVCAGGRGLFGSGDASHSDGATVSWDRQVWNYPGTDHNYNNLYADVVAMFEDLSISQGSGRRAWERVYGTLTSIDSRNTGPQWALYPRDRIQSVRAIPGTGTLALSWTAPSGAACTVAMNPTSSDDSGDATATAHGRAQTYNATGLTAGANTYRITCGTARVSGSATIQ